MADLAIQATWAEPDQARQHFLQVLAPWCSAMWKAGHRLHVEVRLHEDAKTDAQRKYYHGVVLSCIAQQARGADGQQFPMKVWKEYFRAEYLGHKTITSKNPITGKKVRRRERVSTEDLGVKGYSQLIDRVCVFAATELGVTFPMPFSEWERMQVDPDTGEIIGGVCG